MQHEREYLRTLRAYVYQVMDGIELTMVIRNIDVDEFCARVNRRTRRGRMARRTEMTTLSAFAATNVRLRMLELRIFAIEATIDNLLLQVSVAGSTCVQY